MNTHIEQQYEEIIDKLAYEIDFPLSEGFKVFLKQALKDTWNEALKQAEGVLPEERWHEHNTNKWEEPEDMIHNTCREQSLQAMDKLKLK